MLFGTAKTELLCEDFQNLFDETNEDIDSGNNLAVTSADSTPFFQISHFLNNFLILVQAHVESAQELEKQVFDEKERNKIERQPLNKTLRICKAKLDKAMKVTPVV